MIAGVTAPPRWQWSSASGVERDSWRGIDPSIAGRRPELAGAANAPVGYLVVDAIV
jgi:hypothetical protein